MKIVPLSNEHFGSNIISVSPVILDDNNILRAEDSIDFKFDTTDALITMFFDNMSFSEETFSVGNVPIIIGVIIKSKVYGIHGSIKELNKLVTDCILIMRKDPDVDLYNYISALEKL